MSNPLFCRPKNSKASHTEASTQTAADVAITADSKLTFSQTANAILQATAVNAAAEINKAKEILAFEITKLVHGEEEANKAMEAARAAFSSGSAGIAMADIPTTTINSSEFDGEGMGLVNLLKQVGLVQSNSDGFRTIEQGGLSLNGNKILEKRYMVTKSDFDDGVLIIKKGKKKYHKIELA